jgi:RND family efflux transporter MFP subunit
VRLGQLVHKGAVLATLEQTEVAAQVEAARAQLRAAEAQLRMSEDTERRTSALVASGAQAQASGVAVENQRALAAAQADSARAQLQLSTTALGNTTLTAPFVGYVTKLPSGPGAIVSPGVPLFHVQETGTLKLVGTVGEADAPLVHPGATVEISTGGRTIEGTVTAVLGAVDSATRRVPIEAAVKNDGAQPVLAGSFVRAEVRGVGAVPVVKLPPGSLRIGSQDELMVVENGRLHARRILFATAEDGALLVRAGLDAKETVLAGAPAETKEGAPVLP